MTDTITDINVLGERALRTKADRQRAASWIGKAAHEIGLLTGFDGGRAHRNAKCLANIALSAGDDLSEVDPAAYASQIFGRWHERMPKAA